MIYLYWDYMTYLTPSSAVQTRDTLSTVIPLREKHRKAKTYYMTVLRYERIDDGSNSGKIIINHQVYFRVSELWSSILTHSVAEGEWLGPNVGPHQARQMFGAELYHLNMMSLAWIELHRLICLCTAFLTSAMETRLGLAHPPHAAMNIFIVEVWLARNLSMVSCRIPMGSE